MKNVLFSMMALALAVLLLPACDEDNKEKIVPVSGVSLNKTTLSLVVGTEEVLVTTVLPENATRKGVNWSSNKSDVASVLEGKVIAKSPGTCIITASTIQGTKIATCEVTVTAQFVPVESVLLNKQMLTLAVGASEKLVPTVLPAIATNKDVTWSASPEGFVTIEDDGTVNAVGIGATTVTVTTDNGAKMASCYVTVTPVLVTEIVLNKTTLSLEVGTSETLEVTDVIPDEATNKNVIWSSNNPTVATVDQTTGLVEALSEGDVTITATAADGGGAFAACELNVFAQATLVTSIELNKTEMHLSVGQNETLTPTVLPEDATNKDVTWGTDKPEVATVNNGVVTAVGPGAAKITATAVDGGGAFEECVVTVEYPSTGWIVKTYTTCTTSCATDENGSVYAADGGTSSGLPSHMFNNVNNNFLGLYKPGQGGTTSLPAGYEPGEGTQPNPVLPGFSVDMQSKKKFDYIIWKHRGDNQVTTLRVLGVNVYGSDDNVTFTKINPPASTTNERNPTGLVWIPCALGYVTTSTQSQGDGAVKYKISIPESEYQYIRIEYAMWSNIYDSHFKDFMPGEESKYVGSGAAASMGLQVGYFGVGYSK